VDEKLKPNVENAVKARREGRVTNENNGIIFLK
jgi:hypothetical protein